MLTATWIAIGVGLLFFIRLSYENDTMSYCSRLLTFIEIRQRRINNKKPWINYDYPDDEDRALMYSIAYDKLRINKLKLEVNRRLDSLWLVGRKWRDSLHIREGYKSGGENGKNKGSSNRA